MKNIHVLPTDKPSRLHLYTDENGTRPALCELEYSHTRNTQNIYITSDEEIKKGDWCLDTFENLVVKCLRTASDSYWNKRCKKIILTTDQDLIEDGVQAIEDDFLEWFVNNPSCEEVKIKPSVLYRNGKYVYSDEIIIPKEEPKQGTMSETIKIACVQCCGTGEIQKSTNRKQSNFECDLCNGRGHWNKVIEPKQELERGTHVGKEVPFRHECRVLSTEEVLANRSNAYEFIDFEKQETLEEAAENFVNSTRLRNYKVLFIEGAKWQQEQILDFLYSEITERRDYSASKMCYKVIEFIKNN